MLGYEASRDLEETPFQGVISFIPVLTVTLMAP